MFQGVPFARVFSLTVAALPLMAMPLKAQVLHETALPSALALTIAQTALETCKANGYNVSVTIVGRYGEVRIQVRGDQVGPHTMENSMRKAYTARTFRVTSGEFAQRMEKDPVKAAMVLDNIVALAGALPIKVGDDVVGAVGVSGAPGGDKDEVCAKAGIDKVAAQLK